MIKHQLIWFTNYLVVGVRECNSVLQTFIQRQKDPEYIKYIQKSNANCNYASQAVCCPLEEPNTTNAPSRNTGDETPIAQPTPRSGTRLPVPSEGCGVSKVPHNRVVGGVPAKKGKQEFQCRYFKFNDFMSLEGIS